jgi:hypothetical protein
MNQKGPLDTFLGVGDLTKLSQLGAFLKYENSNSDRVDCGKSNKIQG